MEGVGNGETSRCRRMVMLLAWVTELGKRGTSGFGGQVLRSVLHVLSFGEGV